MFDDIYSYIMKSFTDLKTIDDIMHIVDGIKGYGGLGYKPYYMKGGMIEPEEEEIERGGNKEKMLIYATKPEEKKIVKKENKYEEEPDIYVDNEELKDVGEKKKEEIKEEEKKIVKKTKTIKPKEVSLIQFSGFDLFKNLKSKYNIDEANGLVFEKLILISQKLRKPLQDFTKDNSEIKDGGEWIKNKWFNGEQSKIYFSNLIYQTLIENLLKAGVITKEDETKNSKDILKDENGKNRNTEGRIKKYIQLINIYDVLFGKEYNTYLPPWKTVPYDLESNKNLYENKNYIKAGTYPGETIGNKSFNLIQKLKQEGKTRDEIDKYFEDNNYDMPTIPITWGKLTGKTKNNDKIFNSYRLQYREDNGKKYVEKLIYKGTIFPEEGKEFFNNEFNIIKEFKGKETKIIYDMLTNNARVFYSPLDDIKAKIDKNNQIKLPYDTKLETHGKYYLVPYSVLDINIIT